MESGSGRRGLLVELGLYGFALSFPRLFPAERRNKDSHSHFIPQIKVIPDLESRPLHFFDGAKSSYVASSLSLESKKAIQAGS